MPVKKHPCIVDGIYYESETAAARALGIGLMVLRSRLRSLNFPKYVSKHHKKVEYRRIPSISCTIKGVEYASITCAARKLGRSPNLIFRRLRSFDFPDYVSTHVPKVAKPTEAPRYEVDGKKYHTLQEIGNMEGLTRERIRQKMNSPKHPRYQRL